MNCLFLTRKLDKLDCCFLFFLRPSSQFHHFSGNRIKELFTFLQTKNVKHIGSGVTSLLGLFSFGINP